LLLVDRTFIHTAKTYLPKSNLYERLFQLNILFVGDVFGSPGRRIVREHLHHVLQEQKIDLVIINAENAAGGFGVTPAIAEELFDLGAHVLTSGNHIWDKRDIIEYIQATLPGLLDSVFTRVALRMVVPMQSSICRDVFSWRRTRTPFEPST
jgi:hypothetical protein